MVYKLNKKLEIANQKILRLRNGEKNENYGNLNIEIGDCINCSVMRDEKNLLEGKIEELNNEIKEKDEEIKKLHNKNQSFNSGDSNNEDKISKVKNLYELINSSLDNIHKENKKISWDNISNNLIIQNENFNKLISNYVKNSNKNEFFDEMNKMLLNNIKKTNDTNYNIIYDEYIKNLNDIFSIIENNNNKIPLNDLLNIFSTNFFYEYLHYYFSYQLLNKAYEKMKSDNESLNNINNELTSLIENILSLNYEMANNNLINEKAINLLKTLNNHEIIPSKTNKNYNSMIHSENYNLPLPSGRMSVTFGNDISQKFIKIVSKKNLNLRGKQNRKCNAIVTLNNPINNNIFNNNDNIIDENIERMGDIYITDNINNKIENINNIDITKSKNITYSKTIPNEEFEVIENKKILSETKENHSNLKMIKQIFITNIKKNEDLIQEIENMKKDFDNIINYNSNYFTNLILNKNNNLNNQIYDPNLIIEENESEENTPKNSNRNNKFSIENYNEKNSLINNDNNNNKNENTINNNLINKEEKIISSKIKNLNNTNDRILLNSRESYESYSDIKKNNNEEKEKSNTEINDYDNDLTPKSENIQNYTYLPQTRQFFNKISNINKKMNISKDNDNKILKSIKQDNNIINNNNSNEPSNYTRNSEQNSISIHTVTGDKNHSKAFSNLFYENSNLNIINKNKKINNDKIIPLLYNKEKNHLEKSIEKYLETGTASRRFDGIKVNFNNGIINYEYASGLSAKQKLENNPLQNQKIKELNGDDDTPFI